MVKVSAFPLVLFAAAFGALALEGCGDDSDSPPPAGAGGSTTADASEDSTEETATSEDSSDGSTGNCAPPTDPSKAALCLTFKPETIKAIAGNEALDGQGLLTVEVFDKPFPGDSDGGTATSIASAVRPEQDLNSTPLKTLNLFDPIAPVWIDNLPATTLYVRVFFFDNFAAIQAKLPLPGTWLGGFDLTNGIGKEMPLQPVALTAGQTAQQEIALTALRSLVLKLSLASGTTPLGDGQGPAGGALFQEAAPKQNALVFGVAAANCLNIKESGGATLHGLFVGQGPYYTLGYVYDFGGGSGLPPGSLSNVEMNGSAAQLPESSRLTFDADAYQVTKDIQFGTVTPFQGTPPSDNTHCSP